MEDAYDQENFYHDELERDWDEPYEPCNEDAYLDAAYEDRYDLGYEPDQGW